MKKYLLPFLTLFGAAMVGCSSDNIDTLNPGQNNQQSSEAQNSYVTVTIISPAGVSTRANDGVYENGTASENKVNKIRFFFFNDAGNPSWVNQDPQNTNLYYSYIDWSPNNGNLEETPATSEEEGSGGSIIEDETVEKTLTTILNLNIPESSSNPTQILAVINPTTEILALSNPSMENLKEVEENYLVQNDVMLNNNNFVMSNSVYLNDDGQIIVSSNLVGHIFNNPEEAENNPVIIYVERVLARLDFAFNSETMIPVTDSNNVFLVKSDQGENMTDTEGNQIYVRINGFGVTTTPQVSRLIKSIDPEWTNESIFGNNDPWNSDDYHRSFWAINPEDVEYEFLSYDKIPAWTVSSNAETRYMQENAQPNGEYGDLETYTNVIISGTLIDGNGKEITITEFGNNRYTLEGLKLAVASNLPIWQKNSENNYTQISTEDFSFEAIDGTCYVTVKVDETKEWYIKNENGYEIYSPTQIDDFVKTHLPRIMIWNEGMTYYYLTIRHLGAEGNEGYYGVVRNHIYKATVNKITGLGTPVYNPEQEIIPEKPNSGAGTINAEIRILQWRVVTQGYDLYW